ncbi:MAG: glutathione S-transferase family protein [Bdellovibrionales bacterium]|nr:glutathione S-transferase family protein [Bdellovibrionales bacterium]
MGQLVDGKWTQSDVRIGNKNDSGEFLRKPVTFRSAIENSGKYRPESGRYHLYVSYACPWAHRTLIMRALKKLDSHISISAVSPYMLDKGWSFLKDFDDIPHDPIEQHQHLKDLYVQVDSKFTGRVTVPVLYDTQTRTIVNNESSEIIRIFNECFSEFGADDYNYYPQKHQSKIEEWNEIIYENINNGVYRCGFATTQEAYEAAFKRLFETLERVDLQLQKCKWLCGEDLTEADIRLFPTLIRFDSVYHTHFKCNGQLISQYQGLKRYVDDFLMLDGIRETINMDHIKAHYYYSHKVINPSQIVPLGPLKMP